MSLSFKEGYAVARNAKDLTVRSEVRGAADFIAAAGMAQQRRINEIGFALHNVRDEWDTAGIPDFSKFTDLNQYNTEMILLMGKLKHFGKALAAATEVSEMYGGDSTLAFRVLWWWLDSICDACHGRGYQVIEGTKRLSDKACPACHGSGRVPIPGGDRGRDIADALEVLCERSMRQGRGCMG